MARKRRRGRWGRWGRLSLTVVGVVLALVLLAPIVAVVVYRFVPPPVTPLMLIRAAEGAPIHKHWMPLRKISPNLQRAVMASEDSRFCEHNGFDWQAINDAIDRDVEGGRLYGASTISQQTAKNLLLWPSRTFIRKGVEAYITVLLETLWSKKRILEVYLNIVEWGNGIYGAEEAAQRHFGVPASALTPYQAALLAVTLPDPRRRDPARPTRFLSSSAYTILARMSLVPFRLGPVCP